MTKYADRVEGLGIAGTPDGGVLSVQGVVGGVGMIIEPRQPLDDSMDPISADMGSVIAYPALLNSTGGVAERMRVASSDALTSGVAAAGLMGHNGSNWNRLEASDDDTDDLAPSATLNKLVVMARLQGYDPVGDAWDRVRLNSDGSMQSYNPSESWAFMSGGANLAATLTIPLPGSGLRIYVTYLRISRIATAALAGGALLSVTTTNLSGTPTFRTGNLMVAGGTSDLINQSFDAPLRAPNTNTTVMFVCPAPGAGVHWDLQAAYFTAP